MERRMLLAVVLSFFVVTLYSAATGRCQPPPPPEQAADGDTAPDEGDGDEEPATPAPAPEEPDGTEPAPAPAPAPAPEEEGPQADYVPASPRTVATNDELEVTFTSAGGAIEAIRLRHERETEREALLDLVVPAAPDLLLGQVDTRGLEPAGEPPGTANRKEMPAGPLRRLHWRRDEAAEAATADTDVVYVFETADGGRWTKRWVLPQEADRYDVRLLVSWRPGPDEAAATEPRPLRVLASAGLLREGATGAAFLYPNEAMVRTADMSSPTRRADGLPLLAGADSYDVRMLGARTHYYMCAYYTEKGRPRAPRVERLWATGEPAGQRDAMERAIIDFYRDVRERDVLEDEFLLDRIRRGVAQMHFAWMVVGVPPTPAGAAEAVEVEMPFYVGPIDRRVLGQDEYAAVEPVIEYQAAFDLLAKALLAIYDVFRSLLGNAGVAVVLMTLVVRGLMMPLSIKNQLSMRSYSRKISRIKPKLEAIKEKYASNLRRLREEQAKLYREHGVGFPMGCLMMLVQIPIFFALFSSLRAENTLRNASFLWIQDLSGPDKLVEFGSTFNLMVIQVFSLNILPLLMVGLSIWQQRLMPKPADEQQAQQMRMMKWMPIIFAVILYNYTAALALYMVLSAAFSIVEGKIVRSRDDAARVAETPAEA